MRKTIYAAALSLLILAAERPQAAEGVALDTAAIEGLTGLKGNWSAKEGVFKVSYPRNDIHAAVGGVALTPAMGLTAWAAFTRHGGETMVMGDIVLLEDQVNPVMSAALESGLEVTALHNHFLWDAPKVMFMHISGMGGEGKLAAAVGAVFAKLKATAGGKGETPEAKPLSSGAPDPAPLDAILSAKGEVAGGVYKVVFAKATSMAGRELGAAMGANTWAAFAGSDSRAVVDGDFAMYEGELQGVLKALRRAGLSITAIHSHMAGESPRVLFLHYWGLGRAQELAKGVAAARALQKD